MSILIDNDMRYQTDTDNPLKDGAGLAITTGTVEIEILTVDGVTVIAAKGVATHIGSPDGTWRRDVPSGTHTLPAGVKRALVRLTVGSGDPPNATIERVESIEDRRSP